MNIMKNTTRYTKTQQRTNIKLEDTADNHMLALVIYTLSAFNINTIKKMTTFYLFMQHDYDITSTHIYYAHLNHPLVTYY